MNGVEETQKRVEETQKMQEAKLGRVDSVLERLARMDTKLDILMEERHGQPRRS